MRANRERSERVCAWQRSGLMAPRVAAQHGYDARRLSWWKWPLARRVGAVSCPARPTFLPVRVVAPVASTGPSAVEIILGNRRNGLSPLVGSALASTRSRVISSSFLTSEATRRGSCSAIALGYASLRSVWPRGPFLACPLPKASPMSKSMPLSWVCCSRASRGGPSSPFRRRQMRPWLASRDTLLEGAATAGRSRNGGAEKAGSNALPNRWRGGLLSTGAMHLSHDKTEQLAAPFHGVAAKPSSWLLLFAAVQREPSS